MTTSDSTVHPGGQQVFLISVANTRHRPVELINVMFLAGWGEVVGSTQLLEEFPVRLQEGQAKELLFFKDWPEWEAIPKPPKVVLVDTAGRKWPYRRRIRWAAEWVLDLPGIRRVTERRRQIGGRRRQN